MNQISLFSCTCKNFLLIINKCLTPLSYCRSSSKIWETKLSTRYYYYPHSIICKLQNIGKYLIVFDLIFAGSLKIILWYLTSSFIKLNSIKSNTTLLSFYWKEALVNNIFHFYYFWGMSLMHFLNMKMRFYKYKKLF